MADRTERLKILEAQFEQNLGNCFRLAMASGADEPNDLSELETETLQAFKSQKRRKDWLLGRAALRQLGHKDIVFPQLGLSLSHSGGWAIAVASSPPSSIGLDIQVYRPLKETVIRRLCSASEFTAIQSSKNITTAALQLWSIKEAVWKASGGIKGSVITTVEVLEPNKTTGTTLFMGQQYRYHCEAFDVGDNDENGWITLAVRL